MVANVNDSNKCLTDFLVHRGQNVFEWVSSSDHRPPEIIEQDGRVYERFMDVIYLPNPPDKLSADQIAVVNAIRNRLIETDDVARVNEQVKEAFAQALEVLKPGAVLEWGCGICSMQPYLARNVVYVGVDVDPAVVDFQRRQGTSCLLVSAIESGDAVLPSNIDLIIGVFVFLFPITQANVEVMTAALAEEGAILFNVYHRDGWSRKALVGAFEAAGLAVERVEDPRGLCRQHEYWCVTRPPYREKARSILALLNGQ